MPSTAKQSAASLSLRAHRWRVRARKGLAPDLPDRRGHRGRGHDARRICLVPEHFAPIATFRAHEAGEGKAEARTRGEATKRSACATSVAPGVPKGRALGPLAVVTRARRTTQSPRSATRPCLLVKLRLNSVVPICVSCGSKEAEADSIFRSFSDPLSCFCTSTDVLQLGWNFRLHLKIRPQWLKFKFQKNTCFSWY